MSFSATGKTSTAKQKGQLCAGAARQRFGARRRPQRKGVEVFLLEIAAPPGEEGGGEPDQLVDGHGVVERLVLADEADAAPDRHT